MRYISIQGGNSFLKGSLMIMKREVDFLMTKDHEPWELVEAKSGERKMSESLIRFLFA